jgi:hypothetical protein
VAEPFETFAIPDAFCERLVRIDILGPCRRLVFATRDTSAGDQALVISAKLIVSAEAMIEIGRMMLAGAPEDGLLSAFHPSTEHPN